MRDHNQLLLFIGAGLVYGGLLLALIVGVIFAVRSHNYGFRYGSFFLSGNLVLVPLLGAASVCFYFQFLDSIAYAVAIPTILLCVGVLIAYKLLDFRSKALFIIASIPYLLTLYLSPIAIWNLIYIVFICRPNSSAEGVEPAASSEWSSADAPNHRSR
jgi:hypothetical protein